MASLKRCIIRLVIVYANNFVEGPMPLRSREKVSCCREKLHIFFVYSVQYSGGGEANRVPLERQAASSDKIGESSSSLCV